MSHTTDANSIFSLGKCVELATIFAGIFFQDLIKEYVHTFRVWLGAKSNMILTLNRDKEIDATLSELTERQDCIGRSVLVKISNGGGVPKEGSPLNASITNPIEKRVEWPLTEVSPWLRGMIEQVYQNKQKGVIVAIDSIPEDDPAYAYLSKSKLELRSLKLQFVKEKSKCWYILSTRLTCTPVEYQKDMKLREDVRLTSIALRKLIR